MIPKPKKFFENAAKNHTRIYRSKSICQCDDCIAYLQLGLFVSLTDVDRLFNEQKQGVEFSNKQIVFANDKPLEFTGAIKRNPKKSTEILTLKEKYS